MRIDHCADVPTGRRAAGLIVAVVVLLSAASLLGSCNAKSPLDPSAKVPLDRVELQFGDSFGSSVLLENGIPVFYSVSRTSAYSIVVYAIDDDGVYQNVTGQATLSTSDPAVGRPVLSSSLSASVAMTGTTGAVTITATYASKSSSLTLVANSVPRPLPFLESGLGSVLGLGFDISPRFASVSTESGGAMPIDRALVQWSSSNTRVVSVSGSTLIAEAPGVADITVRYNALQSVYRVT